MNTTNFDIAAQVFAALAQGAEVQLGGRRVLAAHTETGRAQLACVATVWKGADPEPTEALLPLDVSMEAFLQWCEQAVHITHAVIHCHDGTEMHHYLFPEDVPACLRQIAYERALEALKHDHPQAGSVYGIATSGQGYSVHLQELPPCTCGSELEADHAV